MGEGVVMMWKTSIIIVLCTLVAACRGDDDPPCPTAEAAQKASAAFEHCLLLHQKGYGGAGCGYRTYKTFCVKP